MTVSEKLKAAYENGYLVISDSHKVYMPTEIYEYISGTATVVLSERTDDANNSNTRLSIKETDKGLPIVFSFVDGAEVSQFKEFRTRFGLSDYCDMVCQSIKKISGNATTEERALYTIGASELINKFSVVHPAFMMFTTMKDLETPCHKYRGAQLLVVYLNISGYLCSIELDYLDSYSSANKKDIELCEKALTDEDVYKKFKSIATEDVLGPDSDDVVVPLGKRTNILTNRPEENISIHFSIKGCDGNVSRTDKDKAIAMLDSFFDENSRVKEIIRR